MTVEQAELLDTTLRTLGVSLVATIGALLVGVPLGFVLARRRFRGRLVALALVNSGMGVPPVVAGLVVWLLFVRSGPLGSLELVYTKEAMVVAQVVIALPLVIAFSAASLQALPAELDDLLVVLGAGRLRRLWLLAREARLGLMAAVIAAFGAIVSEVGAAMTVGGNLRGSTRVLTTAIVTETSRGNVEVALALGALLVSLTLVVGAVLTFIQQRRA
jgi:tungstate transport system permease protein